MFGRREPKPIPASTPAVLRVLTAADLDGSWIGREVIVGTDHIGRIADIEQHPSAHRTVLYLSGDVLDVKDTTTVTFDTWGA